MKNEIEANDVAEQETSSHREQRLVVPLCECGARMVMSRGGYPICEKTAHTMQLRYGQSVIATDQSTFPEASAPEQISGINNARPVGAGNSLHNVESIHPETKK